VLFVFFYKELFADEGNLGDVHNEGAARTDSQPARKNIHAVWFAVSRKGISKLIQR
jgi:hypothetical protein